MNEEERHEGNEEEWTHGDSLSEQDVGEILNVICHDGIYTRAEIVKVYCPSCGEEFIGTKRHAGGFVAGHQAFHEFENHQDVMMIQMGGE